MGITLNDIKAQRAMLARGDEIARVARQAAERDRLRDEFAAAALSGIVKDLGYHSPEDAASEAYALADAMLRERERNGTLDDCKTAEPAPAADGTGWPTSGAGPALTDAESKAVRIVASVFPSETIAATLRSLLARLA